MMAIAALAGGLAAALALAASRSSDGEPSMPERPANSQAIAPGKALQPILDASPEGAVLWLEPGVYPGPLVIQRPLTLIGPRSAVIQSDGQGMTIRIRADHVTLKGFTIDGSGQRPDLTDSAVHIRGRDIRVEGLRIINALFGLTTEQSERVELIGNEIIGDATVPIGLRGDGIRLWETRDSLVAHNVLDHCRDIVIWYSPRNRMIGNTARYGRYGTHMMYSSDGVIEDNQYVGNVVSVFIMYSHDMKVRRNLLALNASHGMGMGAKDSGDLIVEDNLCIRNNTGLYLDNSPFRPQDSNIFRRNRFEFCDSAVVFHSSQVRNTFEGNTFVANQSQVRVEGRGDALSVTWQGNYFDDYAGYDFDRDGFGDVPYELRSLSNQAIGRQPELAFFRGTPALGLVDMVSQVFPLFQPSPVLVDPNPRMRPLALEGGPP